MSHLSRTNQCPSSRFHFVLLSIVAVATPALASPPAARTLNARQGTCVVSGCSGEFCRDAGKSSFATPFDRFKCFCVHRDGCERLPTGTCGWNPLVKVCVESVDGGRSFRGLNSVPHCGPFSADLCPCGLLVIL
ncbi:hypothetical protein BJ742DRAFT_370902 [Cladochytrium replicatum]|nr:hypothetical protein BJ742DRAFT_370902 [Cladochytrium replicatum]